VTQRLVEALHAARPVEAVLPLLPTGPGVYAWWQTPSALPGVPGTPHPTDAVELLYVGIAPDEPKEGKPPSESNLRHRITRQHLGNSLGSSTLRRGLTSFLYEAQGWTATHPKRKPKLSPEHNRALTAWMKEHLRIAFVEHATPWTIEKDIIVAMQPPLNSKHNGSHDFYDELRRTRLALLADARQATANGR